MSDTVCFLLIGGNGGGGTGTATKGTWKEPIPGLENNGYKEQVPLNDGINIHQLIQVKSATHSVHRAGDFSREQTRPGSVIVPPMHFELDARQAKACHIDLFALMDGTADVRINWRLYCIRKGTEGGNQAQKRFHYMSITGTNGLIGHFQPADDIHMLVCSAEVWQWEQYRQNGTVLRECAVAQFDWTGKTVTASHIADKGCGSQKMKLNRMTG
jgi:hypothetical protein